MSEQIFGDLTGKVLIDDLDNVWAYFCGKDGIDKPLLILDNLLAIQKTRDFLDKIMRENEIGGYKYIPIDGYEGRIDKERRYTGFKDKNGERIYEGNLLSHYAFEDIVVFRNGIFTTKKNAKDQPIDAHGLEHITLTDKEPHQ